MIEARCISKAYGDVAANNCLDITIRPGEILGVLGENGAGKSTLLSILSGMIPPDSGLILVDGVPARFGSPRDALLAGISVAYQHFSLVPTFTIREQLRLAGWTSAGLPDLLASRFKGDERISALSLGERQLVEIAKALVPRPHVLMLDEPTSILSTAETRHLFTVLDDLRQQGTSVVMVTHKMNEAMEVCDRIVVLRRGGAVDSIERSSGIWPAGTGDRLLSSMFGRDREGSAAEAPGADSAQVMAEDAPVLFRLQNLSTRPEAGRHALQDVSLEIHEGEVCAIVGIDGQGQSALADVCAGYIATGTTVTVRGQTLTTGDIRAFSDAGIAYLADDRIGIGTVQGFSVEDNLMLKRQREWPFSRFGRLRRGAIRDHAVNQIGRWHIEPPNPRAPIGTLSGGNIQKVLLARELARANSLLIANNPTHGLDPRTRDLVWQAMERFVDARGGVLLLTPDLDEALMHAHRIGVMYNGRVSPLVAVTPGMRSKVESMMVAGW